MYLAILFEHVSNKDRIPKVIGPVYGPSVRLALERARDLIEERRRNSRLPADALPVRYTLTEHEDSGFFPVGLATIEPEGREGAQLQLWVYPLNVVPTQFCADEIVLRLRRGTPPELRREIPEASLSGQH